MRNVEGTVDITKFFRKLKFVCHWADPFKDLKWSNVPGVKFSSLSKSDDTFPSLQALSNLHYLFGGFMDYLWSRQLDISNFGPADSFGVDVGQDFQKMHYRITVIPHRLLFHKQSFSLVVLDLSKVANPLYLLRDKDLLKSKDPQVVVAAAKLLILNLNEFDLWKMIIEQYFLMTDYSLWEVILNGDSPTPTRVVDGVVQAIVPTIAEQILAKKNELKARGNLLMALPDKHQLKFNIHKDAKSLMEAIEKRLQKLISQLQILDESLSQEDINLKFLRSLPSEWRTHALIWRNKADLEDQSLDDLFNNLKIYKAEVKSLSSTSHTTQNIAFVSSNNTNSTNESVSVITNVSTASTKAPSSIFPNMDNLSDTVIYPVRYK
nr:ribonuclease H-like domain-containing protein [Tanacetum cinerariifolium]